MEGVDFEEFVCGIWNICTWTTEELPGFLFKLYDLDNSKYLELAESITIVLEVFEHYEDMQEANMLVELLRDYAVPGIYHDDWRLYETNFTKFCHEFDEVWRPLKLMQQLLRAKVLGAEWWTKVGTKSRKVLMASLLEFEKEQFGTSGAKETVEKVYNLQVDEDEREKRRLKYEQGIAALEQEQMKPREETETEEVPDETKSLLAERMTPLAKVKEINQENVDAQAKLANKRIVTAKRFWDSKKEYIDKWNRVAKEMDERSDPITQLFKFENRDMQRDLFITFYQDWEEAQQELQKLLFPLEELKKYQGGPSREELIWEKKSIRDLPPEMRPQSISEAHDAQVRINELEKGPPEDLAANPSVENGELLRDGRRGYLQYAGQNKKRVPFDYRSAKLSRDALVVRAENAGEESRHLLHSVRHLKSRGVQSGPIAFSCVDMLE